MMPLVPSALSGRHLVGMFVVVVQTVVLTLVTYHLLVSFASVVRFFSNQIPGVIDDS